MIIFLLKRAQSLKFTLDVAAQIALSLAAEKYKPLSVASSRYALRLRPPWRGSARGRPRQLPPGHSGGFHRPNRRGLHAKHV